MCHGDGMSFFESFPEPAPAPPYRPQRSPWERPDTVIPGSVPGELVLIRTDNAAVAIGSVRSYPNGFEFTVHARLRREDETRGHFDADPFQFHRHGKIGHEQVLRLGVLFANGRRAATTGGMPSRPREPGGLILYQDGGGGNTLSYDTNFWVHPLPPDGPVTLVASWLAQGVAEARAELDGTAIREAAERAITLWPEEPGSAPGASWTTSTITATSPDQQDTDPLG
jgi:hypothetical protein